MARKSEHTGFRNGDLFCFNCGTSQSIPLPMPAKMAVGFFKLFADHHKDCPKTWTEPVNEADGKSEAENVQWWLNNGERGVSSETMLRHLASGVVPIAIRTENTPCDPDDFRRCHLLLEAVPQFRDKLYRMQSVSPIWASLVENWDELTRLLKEQMDTRKDNGMYELMKNLGC